MGNILIVGASSGIGNQLAKDLLAEGEHKLWLASRKEVELDGDYNYQSVDVTKDFELDLPEQLDGLVYCPGSINLKPFHRLKPEDFQNDFELNFLGAVKVIQQALKPLKNSAEASIVLFSTVAVQTGLSFHTSISAAKGSIEGFARSLGAELAPKVRVNVIAPSLTDTPLAERLLSSDEKREANADRHPLKRLGTTKDMANSARFLLGEESSWMSSQVLTVDGGLSKIR